MAKETSADKPIVVRLGQEGEWIARYEYANFSVRGPNPDAVLEAFCDAVGVDRSTLKKCQRKGASPFVRFYEAKAP